MEIDGKLSSFSVEGASPLEASSPIRSRNCEDPLRALSTFLRVVRPGGVVYLAIPDKRFTFDVSREVTSIAHVLRDYHEGPQCSREEHYLEWVREVNHKPESEVRAECES